MMGVMGKGGVETHNTFHSNRYIGVMKKSARVQHLRNDMELSVIVEA
jgi:hypothetical protein